jgi:transcriptional regulator with XRE-family HTH domain
MNIVGKNIRKIRENNGWTQEQLAAKCHLLEWNISRGTLAKIESNVRGVSDKEVKLFSIALKVKVEELF